MIQAKMTQNVIAGVFSNRCPHCRQGEVFKYIFFMNPRCPHCDHVFERERGYFLGAMFLGYIMSAFSTVPTIAIGILVMHEELLTVIGFACLQVCLLTPLIFRFARLAWIYLDVKVEARE